MAGRLALAVIGWIPIGTAILLAAGLPGSLAWTIPLQVAVLVSLYHAPRIAWASAIGLIGAVAGLVLGVVLLTVLGLPIRADAVPAGPIAIAAILGWGAAAVPAAGMRFGGPPWLVE